MGYADYEAPSSWYDEDDRGNDNYMLVEEHEKEIESIKFSGADMLADLIKALGEKNEQNILNTIADLAELLELKI